MTNEEYGKKFKEILDEMYSLTMSKHSDYGDDVVFSMGMKMRFADIFRKYERLKAIIWDEKSIKVSDETLRDTFIDLAVYCIIAIMQMELDK